MRYFILLLFALLPFSLFAQEKIDVLPTEADTLLVVDTMSVECSLPLVVDTFDCRNTYYWQKNRVQKFAASSCLVVGGVSLGIYGLARALASAFGHSDFSWFDLVWGGGSAAVMSASIPLYISAAKNRKKARSMTFGEYSTDTHRKDYRRNGMRYEPSVSLTVPYDDYAGTPQLSLGFACEGRSYLGSSNFDLGVKFCIDWTEYKYLSFDYSETYYHTEVALRLSVLGDYNFRKNTDFNPFIGAGVGCSIPALFFIEPRAGVELFNHHRLTIGAHIGFFEEYDSQFNQNLYISYGYSF